MVGIGVDLAEVAEVRASLERFGDRYRRRLFTAGELADCAGADPAPRLAARLAAKEAAIKALRVAGAQPPWTDFEVRGTGARCELRLHGRAAVLAGECGVAALSVSLTHGRHLAGAFVVATGAPERSPNS